MTVNRTVSEKMGTLLRQLVAQHEVRMAGTVLFYYFMRTWKINEELAARYTVRYFKKYFSNQLAKHRQKYGKVM